MDELITRVFPLIVDRAQIDRVILQWNHCGKIRLTSNTKYFIKLEFKRRGVIFKMI